MSAPFTMQLADARHAAGVAAVYRPFVTDSAVSFEMDPPDAPEMARRIENVTQRTPWLVYASEGDVAGYAYAGRHRERAAYQWSVEVSAYLSPHFHRRGIATSMYNVLFAILREQGFANAYAGATLPNDASVGFHRAAGFTDIGTFKHIGYKFGKWHDVHWMEMRLSPLDVPPTDPIPLPLVRDRVDQLLRTVPPILME